MISLLEESGARLILLEAPAGYGKTTLARQWSDGQNGPVAWYRTTRSSGDVAALAVSLDDLLASVTSPSGRDAKRIGAIASVNPKPGPLGRALVSTYRSLGRDVLLVLDEWESAGTEEAEELVAMLVDELGIRVLVTSRTRPPWFTSRLEVYGEAICVGVDELAMTDAEARDVLFGKPEAVRSVLPVAHGWPAVIGMAALPAHRTLPADAQRAEILYDYLAQELLDSASDEVRDGLTLLAIAGISDPATAALVLGSRAGAILDASRRQGLIRDDQRGRFSIHPLLRDLLVSTVDDRPAAEQKRLAESFLPLVEAERWDEALAVAETLRSAAVVSAALERSLPNLLKTGRVATLRRWVEAGRAAEAESGLVDYADAELALRDGALDRAIARGEIAVRSLTGDVAARAHLLAAKAATLADRWPQATRHLAAAEHLADEPDTRAEALWGKIVQAFHTESEHLAALLAEYESIAPPGPDLGLRAAQGAMLLGLLEGKLAERIAEGELGRPLVSSHPDAMRSTAFLNVLADALCQSSRYEEALEATTLELALADEFELEFVRRHGLLIKAHAAIGLRQVRVAERALAELERRLEGRRD
ncbi:MAG: hypothetical protein ACRDLK_07385, partial [Gaiellaceae bacterium]